MAKYTIDFSTNASQINRQLDDVITSIANVKKAGNKIELTLDTADFNRSINTTFRALDREIAKLQRSLRKVDIGGGVFASLQERLGVAQGRRERGRMAGEAISLRGQASQFDPGSLARYERHLRSLQVQASLIAPNTKEWVALQRDIGRLNVDMKKAQQAAEAIQIKGSLGAFAPGSLGQVEARLRLLQIRAKEIKPDSREWKALNKEIQKLESGLERVRRKPLTAGQRAGAAGGAFLYGGGLGGGAGSALGGVAGGLAGGVPGAFAGAAIGQAVDNVGASLAKITSQAASVQQMQRGLAMASVDAKDFAEAQATVAEMSQRVLMPLEQTTRLFTQLRVNTKQYGLSVAETGQIMEGTALAISATGGRAEDLEGAMRAVVQILSKGGVQAEELRGQLGERFPGAVVKFAQANKLSFEELQTGLEQGQIGIAEFIEFVKKNYSDYAKFSEQLATAPEFAGRRLQVAFEQMQVAIGSTMGLSGASIQDAVTSWLKDITKFVKDNELMLKQMSRDFGDIFKSIVDIVRISANAIGAVITPVIGRIQQLIRNARMAVGAASAAEYKAEMVSLDQRIKTAEAGPPIPTPLAAAAALPFGPAAVGAVFSFKPDIEKLRKQRAEAEAKFKGLGGEAALSGTTELTFGGPGAGMSMERGKADDKASKKKEKSAEDLAAKEQALAERAANQEQQRLIATAAHENQLTEIGHQKQTELDRIRFDLEKSLIDEAYDYRMAAANRFYRAQLSLEKGLVDTRARMMEALNSTMEKITGANLQVTLAKRARAAAEAAAAIPVPVMQAGTIPGAPSAPTLPSSAAGRLIDVANRNLGLFAGQTERCADAIRELYKQAGIAIGTTGRAWDGLTTGLRMASSFFGSDMGQKITRQQDLRPGDLVGFERTYGNWGPGVQTHVGMYAGEGMMYDHSSRRGLVKRPLSTFQGKFMYGVRPNAIAGGSAIPASGPAFSMEKREMGAEFSVEEATAQRAATIETSLAALNAELTKTVAITESLIGKAIGEAFPAEEAKIELEMLRFRNQLQLEGADPAVIEHEEKLYNARNLSLALREGLLNKTKELLAVEKQLQATTDADPAKQKARADTLAKVREALVKYRKGFEDVEKAMQSLTLTEKESLLTTLQHADAMKNMEEVIGLVNEAVDGAMSSYKGLFVDIMSGGDIKEAAKKMQESLSKQALTMFIDFSMKPVEKFFKEQLFGIFGLPDEEAKRREQIVALEAEIAAMRTLTQAIDRNTSAQKGEPAAPTPAPAPALGTAPAPLGAPVGPQALPVLPYSQRFDTPSSIVPPAVIAPLAAVPQAVEETMTATADATQQGVDRLSLAYGGSVNFLGQAAAELGKNNITWQQNLGQTVSAVGVAASSIMGIVAGVSQIKEGGVSGVLGGIGSIAMSLGSALGGFSAMGLFGGGGGPAAMGGGSGIPWNFNTGLKFFANGGVVNGPTLGMVGEGRYNEAIVPLPDGRSIPVKMNDQSASLREAMNTISPMQAMAPILSMKFESTNIGGVEYVSRDQLEAAMASTRRQAAKDGALRGMNMTLDKIQQSPATRSRIGMRGR